MNVFHDSGSGQSWGSGADVRGARKCAAV